MNFTKLGLSTLRMLCSRAPPTYPLFQFAVSTGFASVLLDAFFYSGHPSLSPSVSAASEAAASAVSFCRYCFIPVQSVAVGLFQLLFSLSLSVALPLLVDVLVPGGAVNGTERGATTMAVAARAGGLRAGRTLFQLDRSVPPPSWAKSPSSFPSPPPMPPRLCDSLQSLRVARERET